ncbi:hypothetical protein [Brochothrix thermosphacta]|uniref:hypothetical protein n=1 Tax=Brochothrix thermosphacta TaxID=2756 RepID=UPI003F8E21C8
MLAKEVRQAIIMLCEAQDGFGVTRIRERVVLSRPAIPQHLKLLKQVVKLIGVKRNESNAN